jgi:hypothetical protein
VIRLQIFSRWKGDLTAILLVSITSKLAVSSHRSEIEKESLCNAKRFAVVRERVALQTNGKSAFVWLGFSLKFGQSFPLPKTALKFSALHKTSTINHK